MLLSKLVSKIFVTALLSCPPYTVYMLNQICHVRNISTEQLVMSVDMFLVTCTAIIVYKF